MIDRNFFLVLYTSIEFSWHELESTINLLIQEGGLNFDLDYMVKGPI